MAHFKILLEGIVSRPEALISELPMLTETERQQLLVWSETTENYPRDKCLHQSFEEQARRTPEAVAIAFEDRELTYGVLNRCANRLARKLQGVGSRA